VPCRYFDVSEACEYATNANLAEGPLTMNVRTYSYYLYIYLFILYYSRYFDESAACKYATNANLAEGPLTMNVRTYSYFYLHTYTKQAGVCVGGGGFQMTTMR
jgi:hypothetical protein